MKIEIPAQILMNFWKNFKNTPFNGISIIASEENYSPVRVRVWVRIGLVLGLWGRGGNIPRGGNCSRTFFN